MAESILRQTVLDRLIGTDKVMVGSGETRSPRSFEESVELMKKNLLRDLDWLLNSRRITEVPDPDHEFLPRSIRYFGLEDMTGVWTAPERLTAAIERTIEQYEPRLSDVRVRIADGEKPGDRSVEFVLEATLKLDPDPEHVEFDTVLEITSGKFALQTHVPDA